MLQILKSLYEVEGVRSAALIRLNGELLGHQSHAIYDNDVIINASKFLVQALESFELQNENWEEFNAEFEDGWVIVRKFKEAFLVIITEDSIKLNFVSVAIRIAAKKIINALESGYDGASMAQSAPSISHNTLSQPQTIQHSQPEPTVSMSASALSSSGLNWSGLGSSQIGQSMISVSNQESSTFLTKCTDQLKKSMGPIARVIVKKAVRRISRGEPFSQKHFDLLINDLTQEIPNKAAQDEFRRIMRG
ncbi:roadblock/LC7 domain-containing protein [Myxococcota bacterium]|nr:roadblock/LC7 domain-containing protein [Myxococcota bacterium]MBU1429183.1 roadblock/LC7 domain-containing protein [Myxococcota bacterium]MBU1896750.1 roadblock/LC7 domain-containing protein [Myxococcota bacterium]